MLTICRCIGKLGTDDGSFGITLNIVMEDNRDTTQETKTEVLKMTGRENARIDGCMNCEMERIIAFSTSAYDSWSR